MHRLFGRKRVSFGVRSNEYTHMWRLLFVVEDSSPFEDRFHGSELLDRVERNLATVIWFLVLLLFVRRSCFVWDFLYLWLLGYGWWYGLRSWFFFVHFPLNIFIFTTFEVGDIILGSCPFFLFLLRSRFFYVCDFLVRWCNPWILLFFPSPFLVSDCLIFLWLLTSVTRFLVLILFFFFLYVFPAWNL